MSLPPFLNRYRVVVEVEVGSQPGEEIDAVEHTNEAAFEVILDPGDEAVGLYAQCNFEEEPVFHEYAIILSISRSLTANTLTNVRRP